jgi:hypothetical protein
MQPSTSRHDRPLDQGHRERHDDEERDERIDRERERRPELAASTPMARVPSGWVPMHADRIPIAPPRRRSGASRSTSVLCIAAKADSTIPIATSSITHTGSQREIESATSRAGANQHGRPEQ